MRGVTRSRRMAMLALGRRWCARGLLALLLAAVAGSAVARSGASEYELKAAFLLQFADYVEWPAPVPVPMRVCVLGHDPFGGVLDELAAAGSRAVVIERPRSAEQARGCQIVYLGHRDEKALRRDLQRLGSGPVLTVGEGEPFALDGGVIAFRVEHERVRLTVNVGAAQQRELRISSRLLGIARVVGESGRGPCGYEEGGRLAAATGNCIARRPALPSWQPGGADAMVGGRRGTRCGIKDGIRQIG
ncbi:YfiR family protein [Ectothiorhodospiraceae bacterium 2226]|nr:YfiR family protein [Ectothiorhodospiraceae bacterium 2226]